MDGKTNVAKGRIKEAAGALIGDNKLRNDGLADQAVGHVKQAAVKALDKVDKLIRK